MDPGQLGVLLEHPGRVLDVEDVTGAGPAGLVRDHVGDLVGTIADGTGHGPEGGGAILLGSRPPPLEGGCGGRHCLVDLFGLRRSDRGIHLFGGWVEDVEVLAGALDEPPIDEKLGTHLPGRIPGQRISDPGAVAVGPPFPGSPDSELLYGGRRGPGLPQGIAEPSRHRWPPGPGVSFA